MRAIVDLHIHSKYSRACSRELTPENLAMWAQKKGITVLGTGDFTHPAWFEDLSILEEVKQGLYRHPKYQTLFLYQTEVASIYKQGDKVRRVHNLIFAPNREAAIKLTDALVARGCNVKSDGRPIFGIHCDELVKICKDIDERMEVVPAHAWTPHFGVFGSLSGFDTLEEAYGTQTKYIRAIETGLSSDPEMNWKVQELSNISLISNSDPHSLPKLGREANVFELDVNSVTYDGIIQTIYSRDPKKFLYTIEFFPEEGRYHLDGHADCKFSCEPAMTQKLGGMCPVCGKKLLRGVLARVQDLASQSKWTGIPYKNMIPLLEIVAEVYGVGVASKKVQAEYERLVSQKTEFGILLDLDHEELEVLGGKVFAQAVKKVRERDIILAGGYDGIYGKIQIFTPEERDSLLLKPKQFALF
ncbi:MAG TPA: endonuclease Q family protein [Patescibacteria group bacterium]|nr:endonuclease Q family protein [Patescibacteria group bacterium]